MRKAAGDFGVRHSGLTNLNRDANRRTTPRWRRMVAFSLVLMFILTAASTPVASDHGIDCILDVEDENDTDLTGCDLTDIVVLNFQVPESIRVGDNFQISGMVRNLIDFHIVIDISYTIHDDSAGVCSVTSFVTGAANPDSHLQTYILAPSWSPPDEITTPFVTLGLMGNGDAPGSCSIDFLATATIENVDTGIVFDSMTASFSTKPPLSTSVNAGSVIFNCTTNNIHGENLHPSIGNVQAGWIDFTMSAEHTQDGGNSACPGFGKSAFGVQYLDTDDEDEAGVLGDKVKSKAGSYSALTDSIYLEAGTHNFRLHAVTTDWITMLLVCGLVLAGIALAFASVVVAIVGAIVIFSVILWMAQNCGQATLMGPWTYDFTVEVVDDDLGLGPIYQVM